MVQDETPDDIRPGHFAAREADRGEKGELIRLFERLSPAARQDLLDYAQQLARGKTALREVGPESEVRGGHEAPQD